jgi:hypothetical protein
MTAVCNSGFKAGERLARILAISILASSLGNMGCRRPTEESLILDTVDTLCRLAEQKDLEAMMNHFAEDFTDLEGRDKAGLKSLLSGYFDGRTGIVVHRLGSRQDDLKAGEPATLETEVALSSGGAEALRRLVRISPDIYRLRIELIKSDTGWLVHYAEWSLIGLAELFPESLGEFRKLFPKL